MNDVPDSPGGSKSITQWIEHALGLRLPKLPQTLRNLDKVGAALLDIPIAWLRGKAKAIEGGFSRGEKLRTPSRKSWNNGSAR